MHRSGAWVGAESRAVRLAPEPLVRISRSQAALPMLGRLSQTLLEPRDGHARDAVLALCAAGPDADRLQRVHDARLVRPPALQGVAARWSHLRGLGHRAGRILPGGA